MPLRYSCFISYCHGEGELMRRFIEDLTTALKSYLDPFFDEQIYIDEKRLQPAICTTRPWPRPSARASA